MMNTFKRALIFSINALPYSLALLPYVLVAKIIRIFLCGDGFSLGFRNSYQFKSAVCGLSDIDISFYFDNQPSQSQISKLQNRWRKLKRIFPIVGEVNILRMSEIAFMKRCFNSIELSRDPSLKSQIGATGASDRADKLIFVARMLESETKHFNYWMPYRLAKWNYHFKLLEIPTLQKLPTLEFLLEHIAENFSELKLNELKSLILDDLNVLYEHEDSRRRLIVFSTHRWLLESNGRDRLTLDLEMVDLCDQELALICSSVKWELMGLYTQIGLLNDENSLEYYLKMLSKALELLDQRYSFDGLKEIAELKIELERIVRESKKC